VQTVSANQWLELFLLSRFNSRTTFVGDGPTQQNQPRREAQRRRNLDFGRKFYPIRPQLETAGVTERGGPALFRL
jgi:hypothetical protein